MTKVNRGTHAHPRSRKASALLGVLGLILMSAGLSLVAQGSATAAATVHKSYVCKYVSTPGGGERLQTGQNPIWVDNNSLHGFVKGSLAFVGETFKDGQTRSVVIVANTPKLNPEPTVAACPGVVTPDVLFHDSVCLNGAATNPSWVGSNTADINYAITSGSVANGASVTITATPKAGFAFPANATSVFTHTFGAAATGCSEPPPPTQVTPAVTFHDSVCGDGGPTAPSWTGTNTADIVYTVTSGAVSDGSSVTITATPMSGFVFTSGSPTTFQHTFGAIATGCNQSRGTPVATSAALFKNPSCANSNQVLASLGDSAFLTAAQWEARGNFIDTGKITYTITGSFNSGGTVNVAASADPGFMLTAGSTSQWSHTFTQPVNCGHTVVPPVTIPKVIDSGISASGFTSGGPNSALYTWGYGLAGAGAALFTIALVSGRRRQSVS